MVVKMMFDAFDDLVVFVALSGNKNHISALREGTCRLNRCSTVFDN